MALTYGVVALGRPTFDLLFAEEIMTAAFAALDAAGIRTVGPKTLTLDKTAAERAMTEIKSAARVDMLLLLQITFTDASITVKLAQDSKLPMAIWAFPEPRLGGRLRLNSFCGLNLAAHALGKVGIAHGWLFAAPDTPAIKQNLMSLSKPAAQAASLATIVEAKTNAGADRVMKILQGAHINVIGQHPIGFDTCEYDSLQLKTLAGVEISSTPTQVLFDKAKAINAARVSAVRADVERDLVGLPDLDQVQLDRSLRLFCALQDLQQQGNARSMAIRCWPEVFTEYGCAACGPMAMMNQAKVPCACEADVYGALSALIMQELSGQPAWMADLVDIDMTDNTAVLWHCGLAPLSMCDPEFKPEATIHTNRKMPLLHQFPLKPGTVTLARISQARNEAKLAIAGAEIIRRPMAFTGTSAVFQFNSPAAEVCTTIIEQGLEHHYALAYGEHRETLRTIAAKMDIPILELA